MKTKPTPDKRPVYVPGSKLLVTPSTLLTLQEHYFKGVEPKSLKLKGSLLGKVEQYFPSLLTLVKRENIKTCNTLAMGIIEAFDHIPFVRGVYGKDQIFHTAIKKGSVLVNISKFFYSVKHIKGVTLAYSVVTTTEVLSGQVMHSLGRWDIDVDDAYCEAAADHFLKCVRDAVDIDKDQNAYYLLTDLIFSLTPFK